MHWQIGERIKKKILKGARAEYGQEILATLSQQLVFSFHLPANPRANNVASGSVTSVRTDRPTRQSQLQSTWSIELASCKYCGEPADSMRRIHPACEESFQLGERQIAMEVAGAVSAGGDIEGLPSRIAMVAREARISEKRTRDLVIAGWARCRKISGKIRAERRRGATPDQA